MRANEVISTLRQRGISLKVVTGSLKISGVDKLTDREKAALKAHKSAILKALSSTTATTAVAPVKPTLAVTEPLPNRTEPLAVKYPII